MANNEPITSFYDSVKQDLPAIKPCPFCGSAAFCLQAYGVIQIVCRQCNAEGPPSDRKLDPIVACRQAIERWNNRAVAPAEVN